MAEPILSCRRCASENQRRLSTEIAIHLPGLSTPHVFLFPAILVCLNCGFTEFVISERELPLLTERLAVIAKYAVLPARN